jgi:PAS domain S-box-containing protein
MPSKPKLKSSDMAARNWELVDAEESHDQLSCIVEASDDAIIRTTLDGIIISWNQGAERVYGYLANEVIGKPISILLPPDRADELPGIMDRLRRGESIDHYDTVRQGKDGRLIDVTLTISAIREPLGRITSASSSARDITELKRADAALKVSETRYRRLFETAQDGILILAESGVITDVNPYLLEMLGYSKTQLLGRDLCDIGFVADSDLCQETFRSLQESGYARYNGLPLRTRSGKRLEVEFVSNVYEAGGENVIQCNIRDITEQKLAEAKIHQLNANLEERVAERTAELATSNKALGRERNLLHTLMDNIPDSIYFKDTASRFTVINRAQAQILGAQHPEEALGKTDFDYFDSQLAQEAFADEQAILKSGNPVIGKVEEIKRPDGPSIWVSTTKMQIRDVHGNILGTFGVSRDVTKSKHFEQALQEKNIELERALLSKDRFLASMSHELRTPLNAVIGFTGTLLMKLPGPLTDEQSKQLQTIRSSAKHLLSLLNDLLDLAKIGSGKITLSVEPVVFQSVADEVCTALRPVAEQKGLELKATVPEGQLVINTDRRALRQILFNLINNAIKFTERGEVRIVLDRHNDNGSSWTEFSVHDTGIGIRPEDQPRLFEAFSQLEGNLRRSEGAGLGLQLSRKLAELLGGKISFKSEYGKGSTFTLFLPQR